MNINHLKNLFKNTAILLLFITTGCKGPQLISQATIPLPVFDVEAHRGGRGLMPENTIPAMINALNLGVVNTLEMDAQITSDGKVILAHDSHINSTFTLTPEGEELSRTEAEKLIYYKMKYADIKKFDTGSKPHPDFPKQQKLKTHIPLLSEVIDSVQHYLKANNKPQVFYNIETKSQSDGDNLRHPEPEEYIERIMDIVERKKVTPYVIIQSFDHRTLQVLHVKYPHVKTLLIVSKGTFADHVDRLRFIPTIYAPASRLVTPELVKECHDKGVKILPWTINTKEEIQRLKALKVDGVGTDYPDLFIE